MTDPAAVSTYPTAHASDEQSSAEFAAVDQESLDAAAEPVLAAAPEFDDAPTEALTAVPAAGVPDTTEIITCPECGRTATVTVNRRESRDFCRGCDYPLFWTPAAVLREAGLTTAEESLRRLPGTLGRATLASMPCPHCREPNRLNAVVCVRCGLPMQIVTPLPPMPVYVPPPPLPEPEPEPEQRVSWWVWALIALGAAATIVLAVLAVLGYFN